ncbi:MAG: EF-hand domain-containing protein [Gammaproteobacteria bacterium]|nr:EF-hand domain-containing protein [Gammaproteobacteria bacterium]
MATTLTRTDRNRRYLLVAATVAVTITAAAVTAEAQNRAERFPIDITAAKERAAERFAAVDTNDDGSVSVDEFLVAGPDRGGLNRFASGRRGAGMDHVAGKEGLRAARDRREGMRARRGGLRERMESMQEGVFERADGDGDGALSKEEYDGLGQARREVAMQRMFERLDKDADGLLAPAELGGQVQRLEALDADEDGKVTRSELRGGWRDRAGQG